MTALVFIDGFFLAEKIFRYVQAFTDAGIHFGLHMFAQRQATSVSADDPQCISGSVTN